MKPRTYGDLARVLDMIAVHHVRKAHDFNDIINELVPSDVELSDIEC